MSCGKTDNTLLGIHYCVQKFKLIYSHIMSPEVFDTRYITNYNINI